MRRVGLRTSLPLVGLLVWALPIGTAAARTVRPGASGPAGVGIGKPGSFSTYYPIDQGCPLTIQGPGILSFYLRAHVPPEPPAPDTVWVTLSGLTGFPPQRWALQVKESRVSTYKDSRTGGVTGGKKITLAIPGGLQKIIVTGRSKANAPVFGKFSYDGPPVPKPKVVKPKPYWGIQANGDFSLEVIYDDNICRYSDDTLESFRQGDRPEKFAIESDDDLVLNPTFQIEFYKNRLLFGKRTRFRVRYKLWQYARNDVKSNEEINLRFRQHVRRSDYFEATYTYAPNSYIKELGDREPFLSWRSVPYDYYHFKITRNAFAASYYYRAKSWLRFTLTGGRTLRFYNRRFLENDLWEWNWDLDTDFYYKRFRLRLRYAYADVTARGYDEVGETLETSDNDGDGSYEKDSYRIRITYRPKTRPYRPKQPTGIVGLAETLCSWLDQGLVKIKTNQIYFQYDYARQFYTSERPLSVDPLHVGRLDESFQPRVVWSSKTVWNRISLEAGIRYTERTADAPAGVIGEDDPSEEKDYTGTRYWLSLSRPLW